MATAYANTYFDEDLLKRQEEELMKALQPQISQGIQKTTSGINPYMTGKLGRSLQEEVYNPINAKLAENRLASYQKGQAFEAERPFREAPLTGMYGGNKTQDAIANEFARALQDKTFGEGVRQFDVGQGNWGQQFGLQQELGRGNLGLAQQQFGEGQRQFDVGQGNWGKTFGLQEKAQTLEEAFRQAQAAEQKRQWDIGTWGTATPTAGAKTLEQQRLDEAINEFNKQFGLSEAGLTGSYRPGGTTTTKPPVSGALPPVSSPTTPMPIQTREQKAEEAANAAAKSRGFKNAEDEQIYLANPKYARSLGIYGKGDAALMNTYINKWQSKSGAWSEALDALADEFNLSSFEAQLLVKKKLTPQQMMNTKKQGGSFSIN